MQPQSATTPAATVRAAIVPKWIASTALGLLLVALAPAQDAGSVQSGNTEQQDQRADQQENQKDKKAKSEHPRVKLGILVFTNKNKPVGNASVYVRFTIPGGNFHKDKQVELDLKSNQDGTVRVPEIPQGRIMIQVIAPGWHTYGKWYDIDQDEDVIRINLEPPPHLY